MIMPVISDNCVACGMCVTACPQSALKLEAGKIILSEAACKSCGLCQPVCPVGAIQVTNSREDELYDEIVGLTGGMVHASD
jgi:MinD superfamily P-loop ATPase